MQNREIESLTSLIDGSCLANYHRKEVLAFFVSFGAQNEFGL